MREHNYDIVIVGSGAGGGAAAKELAPLCRQGARIAVLEWGPKFAEEEFTGQELEMVGKLYFESGGVFTRQRTMTLAFARAWGGSTVVYTGTSLSIPEGPVRRWGVPGLEWSDLQRRSMKYLQENNVHLLDEELLNDNNRLFFEACRKLGYRVQQFPVNLKGCQGAGMCNLGCPNAAKQGTHRVQLPAAEAAGVEMITNCKVQRIAARGVLESVVEERPYGLPSPWEPGQHLVHARIVVLAAGAVHSPALLLRSGFGRHLPALGRYFTAHPALILVAEHPRPISNFYGHPKSFYCDHFAERGFLLETCMYFPFVTAKNLIGFGEEHAQLMHRMDRLQMILVLALDPALPDNRVVLDRDGEPVVEYRFTDNVLVALLESMKVSARIFFAAGAERVHAPAGEKFFIERTEQDRLDELITCRRLQPGRISVASAHLMGGCRMGASPADSVTDAWGQVHGVPWLFVADASLFPSCAEINPYVTIMAFADRVAEAVRSRWREV